jgi:hypothetical protein
MHIEDIYRDNNIKFKLDKDEIDIIDRVWEFSDLFNFATITLHEYREKLINNIQKNYTVKEFLILEIILEKLIWNLRWLINPLIQNSKIQEDEYLKIIKLESLPEKCLSIESYNITSPNKVPEVLNRVKDNMYKSNYYRSFINKLIVHDKERSKIYYKHLEGSAPIFTKNELNVKTMIIMRDRKLYEKIMHNPFYIINYRFKIPTIYYQYDYGFPNITLCCPFSNNIKEREERIRKMYFDQDSEQNWFKLI